MRLKTMNLTAIPLQEMINSAVREEKEAKKQESWWASSIGSCLRGQYIQRLGIIPKEFTDRELRIFKVGKLFEDWIISLLKQNPDLAMETQTRLEVKEWDASGKPDLIARYNGFKKVYEFKTKHSQGFKYLPNEHHRQQLWFYLHALEIQDGSLIYLSKDDLRIEEYPVRLDDEELKNSVVEQFKALNEAWKSKNIELLLLPEKTHWMAKYCSYHDYCVNPEKLKELNK